MAVGSRKTFRSRAAGPSVTTSAERSLLPSAYCHLPTAYCLLTTDFLSKGVYAQPRIGRFPRALELAAHQLGLARLALRAQRLREAVERAAVAAVAAEVFAEDRLGL